MRKRLKEERIHQSSLGVPYFFTHDYCLYIYGIHFRDLRGKDLTYIDSVFNDYSDEYKGSLEFTLEFLRKFIKYKQDFTLLEQLSPYQLADIIEVYLTKVVRQPPSRDLWLHNMYYLNNLSYCNLESYENIPMTEILHMINVHIQRIEKEKDG